MSTRTVLVAVLLIASATAALAAPVRHAGEWRTSIDGGPPRTVCFTTDKTFDAQTLTRSMAQHPGVSCKVSGMTVAGPVMSYSVQCAMGGGVMTTTGTTTATGPDAFTTHTHSSGGAIPMGNGRVMTMPPTDMTIVSHRVGPCKPGDHIDPY